MGKGGEVRGVADRLEPPDLYLQGLDLRDVLFFEWLSVRTVICNRFIVNAIFGNRYSLLGTMPTYGALLEHSRHCLVDRKAAAIQRFCAELDTNKNDAKEMKMRPVMLALFGALSASAATMAGAAPAAAYDSPYCLQGRDWGLPGDCSYTSYQACLATASGRGLTCGVNPRVAFGVARQDPRRHGRAYYPDQYYND
jgi:Protein of unknown function (DUF3551)